MADNQTSIHGRRLGLARDGSLVGNEIQITQPAVDATITVGAESTDVRDITVTLLDANGDPITYVETVEVIVFSSAAMTAFATGGSTGIAVGSNGALLAIVAKKLFLATTEATGVLDLTWTDTGTESVAVGIRLPNGRVVVSEAFANA